MSRIDDVIIIGSTPNELVLACYLAKAGKKVTVLETRSELCGTTALHEITKGFRTEITQPQLGFISPKIVKDLGLYPKGIESAEQEWSDPCVVAPRLDGGPALVLRRDLAKSRAEIAKHSKADADKWESFCTRMDRLAGFLETLYTQEPPRLLSEQAGDLFSLMATGLRLRSLGKVDMIELLRTLPMSVQDLLDDWFESDLLKATIGASGITNILQGPRSAGTCFVMLHHLVGRPLGAFRARGVVRSELSHLSTELVGVAKRLGVEMRTGVSSIEVMVKNGRAIGVKIARSGEELMTTARGCVVSGSDPRATFRKLVDPTELTPEFQQAVSAVKLRGARAIVNLALSELPSFRGVDKEDLGGMLTFAPNLDYLERAYDDAKHGGISKNLFLEASIPSITDSSLAPTKNEHVLSISVQYAPYALRDGKTWDETTKQSLADSVIATLSEYAPKLKASIVGRTIHTPMDLEKDFGLTEGHLYGGELTLDQILFMRPIPGFAHYRTPIEGLFMCGDTCHPGGAMPGLAGANAAREILKELSS